MQHAEEFNLRLDICYDVILNDTNLKSENSFNYAIAGAGIGITFFNGLAISTSLACPYTGKKFNSNNAFINFGIDIPIIEYIGALSGKRQN